MKSTIADNMPELERIRREVDLTNIRLHINFLLAQMVETLAYNYKAMNEVDENGKIKSIQIEIVRR